VGQNATILKTTDGGTNWVAQNSGITGWLGSVHFQKADTGYVAGSNTAGDGIILKTNDGGTTWFTILQTNLPGGGIFLRQIFFLDNITGYVLGYSTDNTGMGHPIIIKTNDGGTNWTFSVFSGSTASGLGSIFFTDANNGYAVGSIDQWPQYPGVIVKTIDGGTTWTDYLPTSTQQLNSVCFPDANTGYAVSAVGEIIKTIDGGATWNASSSGTTSSLQSVFFPNSDTGYSAGYNYTDSVGTIIKTTDGGITWTTLPSETGSKLTSVYFTNADTGYVVGEYGIILKTTNGGGFPVGIAGQYQTASTAIIYPNPASTIITLETPFKGSLTVHNLSGQVLLKKSLSESKTTIDISNLNTGLYIVKVMGQNTVRIGKIIKE
jgi:photosystem II stability/assembly factor-like uncharacterized protein